MLTLLLLLRVCLGQAQWMQLLDQPLQLQQQQQQQLLVQPSLRLLLWWACVWCRRSLCAGCVGGLGAALRLRLPT
jgi:hypothetical protein